MFKDVLRDYIVNARPTREDARARIDYGVAAGKLTADDAAELYGIADAYASAPSETDVRIQEIAGQAESVRQAVADVGEMIRVIRPVAQHVAAEVYDDARLVGAAALFDEWEAGKAYTAGTVLRHGDMLYRVLTAHTAQAHQLPGGDGMLAVYAPVQAQTEEEQASGKVLPWVHGETGLKVGDRREYNGVVYEAIQPPGANVWTPNTVAAIWRAVA